VTPDEPRDEPPEDLEFDNRFTNSEIANLIQIATVGSLHVSAPADGDLVPKCDLLPFSIPADEIDDRFRDWAKRQRLSPESFRHEAEAGVREPVLLPYWVGEACVHVKYRGRRGELDEQVGQHPTRGAQTSRTMTWSSARDDEFDLPNFPFQFPAFNPDAELFKGALDPLAKIKKRWKLDEAKGFRRTLLDGRRVVTASSRNPSATVRKFSPPSQQSVTAEVRAHIGGDDQRFDLPRTQVRMVECRLVLPPAWIVNWSHREDTGQMIIDGYSGAAVGNAETSAAKVTIVALLMLVALIIACGLLGRLDAPADTGESPSGDATTQEAPPSEDG
jgi:predicted small lipoprotein YifL